VTLDARWRLVGRDGQELALKRSTMSEPATGSGYQSLVVGMNRLLNALAREISAEILTRADARASGS
jgi:ABC-type tungstate transport system permease subunit